MMIIYLIYIIFGGWIGNKYGLCSWLIRTLRSKDRQIHPVEPMEQGRMETTMLDSVFLRRGHRNGPFTWVLLKRRCQSNPIP